MCGRYVIKTLYQTIADCFAAITPQLPFAPPRYNVAPSQDVPVVRLNHQSRRTLGLVRWGLIPSWQPQDQKPKIAPINAKSETVATSRIFSQAFARRRCLMPADGFYEWSGAKPKQPYYIHDSGARLLAFAGLWERWKPAADAEPLDTCALLTTTPNAVMRPIHNRMPVILSPQDWERWLDPQSSTADLLPLLRPYTDGELRAYAVSRQVNRPQFDDPSCIAPLPDGGASP